MVEHGSCEFFALFLFMKIGALDEKHRNDHQCCCCKATSPFIYALFRLQSEEWNYWQWCDDQNIKLTYHMVHCTLQSDLMLDFVAVNLIPNQLHHLLEFGWLNTPWVYVTPTPVHKGRYVDATPGISVLASRWKVLVIKLTARTFS